MYDSSRPPFPSKILMSMCSSGLSLRSFRTPGARRQGGHSAECGHLHCRRAPGQLFDTGLSLTTFRSATAGNRLTLCTLNPAREFRWTPLTVVAVPVWDEAPWNSLVQNRGVRVSTMPSAASELYHLHQQCRVQLPPASRPPCWGSWGAKNGAMPREDRKRSIEPTTSARLTYQPKV